MTWEVNRNHTTDDQLHWLVWNIPGDGDRTPEGVPMGAQLQNGAYQISASGAVYRGPGAPATGPRHHYTFELIALDTKIDVQPGTDAFETRTMIMKATQGHILGKAVYMVSSTAHNSLKMAGSVPHLPRGVNQRIPTYDKPYPVQVGDYFRVRRDPGRTRDGSRQFALACLTFLQIS